MRLALVSICLLWAGLVGNAVAMDDSGLAQQLVRGLNGDVNGGLNGKRADTCLAVAVVDRAQVAHTYWCGSGRQDTRINDHTAFEIGSISKTMTAALLADLINQGKASLDDPLSAYLPPGTPVPAFQGQAIRLRHLVTHFSGLPAQATRMAPADPRNPYADIDERVLLASLADVRLTSPPGTRFEYSTLGYMLLSYAVAHRAGTDFETLARKRLFTPIGMRNAYVTQAPAGIHKAAGHNEGRAIPEWTFPTDLSGTGGVRATLPDMVRYLQAQLGQIDSAIGSALTLSQQRLAIEPDVGMGWFLIQARGRVVHTHDGGTGGFSSVMLFDRNAQRGVVILSDTAWTPQIGITELGLHLLDLGPAPGRSQDAPRVVTPWVRKLPL
ncbi:serine hydrolase domain-containing protein [Pigmentiphaga aceris]|nr:serine hydrolase domain-containing protein [Pigmentiphaga aceris]